ncbi:MAG: DoxX family protein [Aquamicrobium sp.]|uniref:DoxX family protein n=1 Tax=Aquamicrobium sp. TaxID=1872579 RepID=UPI00349EA6F7|nr:DoxX family protein [Aquamicrobium sp.]
MANDLTLLVARVLLALMFLISGIPMLMAPGGFAGFMGSIGMPAPMLVTWAVIALKVLGGIALVVGFQTRWAAYAFAAFCLATAFIGHSAPEEASVFWKNIALVGGFLALSVSGPGGLSVDAKRG